MYGIARQPHPSSTGCRGGGANAVVKPTGLGEPSGTSRWDSTHHCSRFIHHNLIAFDAYMSESTPQQTIDASFAMLQGSVERMGEIAPVDSPERLRELIPETIPSAQQLILLELVKLDMAAAADASQPRKVDFYKPLLDTFLPHEHLPLDLVLEEIRWLQIAGKPVESAEYRSRFPHLAEYFAAHQDVNSAEQLDTAAFSGIGGRVPELPVGQRVDDFTLLKLLGDGAFARVYLARQESMQRLVALKATNRGSEEPQALSRLDHPNIVRVYDQRTIAEPPTTLLYMQYVAGGTLADCIGYLRNLPREQWSGQSILESIDRRLLAAGQAVPEQSPVREHLKQLAWPAVVAWIGIRLAEGLGYAHSQSILHRDVKPANILLSTEAIPKLADFNVSCSGLSGRAGAAAYFGGSLAYMSPEQLRVADPTLPDTADQLDGRSDLFALGMVLWELWQGRRPWSVQEVGNTWSSVVQEQLRARQRPLTTAYPSLTSAERLLERVLRGLMQYDRNRRPQTGTETAGRLRLALHPQLARRFEPETNSLAGRLLRIPVLLLAAILIFGPNAAASRFNYVYNGSRMISDFVETGLVPTMEVDFRYLSNWVNGLVFPVGAVLFWWLVHPVRRIVARARENIPATEEDIDLLWGIGFKASWIGGLLWALSGVVFAVGFYAMHVEFDFPDAFHFFVSLILCGGVAWIYPYFGMTLVSILVYYPKVIAPSMQDEKFSRRSHQLIRQCQWYLLSAAAIPLTAVGMLVLRESLPRELILLGVGITALGLVAAYYACEKLRQAIADYAEVLGDEQPDQL